MNLLRTVLCLCLAVVGIASCGDDDGGDTAAGETSEYSEAVASSLRESGEDLPFTEEQVECLSVQFVDVLGGPSALEEAGIEPEELEAAENPRELGLELGAEEADEFASSFADCNISLAELILAEAGDDVPEDVRTCVQDNIDEEALADFFAQVLLSESGEEQPPEAVLEPLIGCFTS